MVPVKSCSKGTPLSEETWHPSKQEAVASKAAERCLCMQQGTAACWIMIKGGISPPPYDSVVIQREPWLWYNIVTPCILFCITGCLSVYLLYMAKSDCLGISLKLDEPGSWEKHDLNCTLRVFCLCLVIMSKIFFLIWTNINRGILSYLSEF